jgi:DNA-binding transcriptional MerR regulator
MNEEANLDNNEETTVGCSITEASQKLSLPDNTIRKYLIYFSLKVQKVGRKNTLPEETMASLDQIIKLKNNGWSLQQIKDFMEKSPSSSDNAEESQAENETQSTEEPEVIHHSQEAMEVEQESFTAEKEGYLSVVMDAEEVIETDEGEEQQTRERKISFLEGESTVLDEETEAEQIEAEQIEEEQERQRDYEPASRDRKRTMVMARHPLTKDYVNREIAVQAKRASRLYRFLSSRNMPRDTAEVRADLDRRVVFLNGLRYLRDNWLERKDNHHYPQHNRNNHHNQHSNRNSEDLVSTN